MRRRLTVAAFSLAIVSLGRPVAADTPGRVSLPGTAFTAEGRGDGVVVADLEGGRRFRGPAGSRLVLRGTLRLPPSTSDPRIQKLVVHFSTSGPSLRAVELINGSTRVFRIETMLTGDFTGRETTTPDFAANAWVLQSIKVSSQTVFRLEVQFPVGFDSPIDPGAFFLKSVDVHLVPQPVVAAGSKFSDRAKTRDIGPLPGALPPATKGVLYAWAANGDLLWYRHDGRADGSRRWAAGSSNKVGNGWNFKQVFSGGDGVVYAITDDGDLLWYRHDGRADGTFRWAADEPKKVGNAWNFKQVFSGGDGVLYSITADGDLLWYRHSGRAGGSFLWAPGSGNKVGTGWNFKQVFSGGDGVLYAITADGDLLWYRHDGRTDGSFRWAPGSGNKVGTDWNFKQVFSGGDGVLYAITAADDLLWYRHDGRADGSFRWAEPQGSKVGNGWTFREVFSGD